HAVPYGLLLAAADRFLIYALFHGDIRSLSGAVIDTYCILFSALITYRLTLTAQMVRQYPWLYERVLLFGWRARRGTEEVEDEAVVVFRDGAGSGGERARARRHHHCGGRPDDRQQRRLRRAVPPRRRAGSGRFERQRRRARPEAQARGRRR